MGASLCARVCMYAHACVYACAYMPDGISLSRVVQKDVFQWLLVKGGMTQNL